MCVPMVRVRVRVRVMVRVRVRVRVRALQEMLVALVGSGFSLPSCKF
jgi:hypothetical protein